MKSCRTQFGQALLGLTLCICGWETAVATSLSLVPVRIALTAKQPISAITVRNDGDEATVVQLEVANWSQAEGKDVYTATTEILATPPIFTVAPGGSQLVRIGLRRAADADHELAYRVFMQEIPAPPTPDFKGLHVALRFGVPVFVAPASASAKRAAPVVPTLQWQAHTVAGTNQIRLTATNTGVAHVQVTHFTLMPSDDPVPPAEHKSPQYVFPGQHKEWQVELKPVPAAGTKLHVSAGTDAGIAEADIVVETP